MRSGKDSVAACLRALYPDYRQVSFAWALKNEVAAALNSVRGNDEPPYSVEFFNRDENRPRFRPLLQWWGTEFRRAQDPHHWVKRTAQAISVHQRQGHPVLCTDGRFTNELDMLAAYDCRIIRLDMPRVDVEMYLAGKGLSREEIARQLSHESEIQWQAWQPDATFESRFGNLVPLTFAVASYLRERGDEPPSEDAIRAFYAKMYPETYGA